MYKRWIVRMGLRRPRQLLQELEAVLFAAPGQSEHFLKTQVLQLVVLVQQPVLAPEVQVVLQEY